MQAMDIASLIPFLIMVILQRLGMMIYRLLDLSRCEKTRKPKTDVDFAHCRG
jgi:hypothetical protein